MESVADGNFVKFSDHDTNDRRRWRWSRWRGRGNERGTVNEEAVKKKASDNNSRRTGADVRVNTSSGRVPVHLRPAQVGFDGVEVETGTKRVVWRPNQLIFCRTNEMNAAET